MLHIPPPSHRCSGVNTELRVSVLPRWNKAEGVSSAILPVTDKGLTMAMKNPKFLRMKHVIRTLEYDSEGTVVGFEDKSYMYKKDGQDVPSISAAKRASRELQKANGGLGMGSLKRVDKFPPVSDISKLEAA